MVSHNLTLNKLYIKTDASRNKSDSSVAFHSPQLNKIQRKITLHPLATVYSAELIAILLAVKRVQKLHSPLFSNILIISDSKAAIQNATNPLHKRKTSPIIIFIRKILEYLMHFHHCKIEFIWVPGQ